MRFSSKIDIWLVALIFVLAFMALKAAYIIILHPYGVFKAAVLFVSGVVLPIWILFSTNYHVIDGNLWINSGPFKWKILTLSISRIEFSKSWIFSPALSLDRIKIEYDGEQSIMVSPKEKTKFLNAIRSSISYDSRYQETIKKHN
jgi:hypothetical protein